MKKILAIISTLALSYICANAGNDGNNLPLSFYGDVSNYMSYSSRPGVTDDSGMLYLLPIDREFNQFNVDLNKHPMMSFLNLDTRLGVKLGRINFTNSFSLQEARVEADFMCKSGSKSVLRLRKAYFTLQYDLNLLYHDKLKLLVGQTWHPLAKDRPFCQSLSCGAPFNPYSFAPQVKFTYSNIVNLDLALLWQNDYRSTGPDGFSQQYITWSCKPEFYLGLNGKVVFKHGVLKAKTGLDFLTIKPRITGNYPDTDAYFHVNDKVKNMSFFAYLEYTFKDKNHEPWLTLKGKTVLAQSGEHLLLLSGYGITNIPNDDPSRQYTPYHVSSSWISAEYGRSVKAGIMLGYYKNLGVKEQIYTAYFYNGLYNILSAARIAPSVQYTYHCLTAALEYELTSAQYGDKKSVLTSTGLASENFRTVNSNRVTLRLSCKF